MALCILLHYYPDRRAVNSSRRPTAPRTGSSSGSGGPRWTATREAGATGCPAPDAWSRSSGGRARRRTATALSVRSSSSRSSARKLRVGSRAVCPAARRRGSVLTPTKIVK